MKPTLRSTTLVIISGLVLAACAGNQELVTAQQQSIDSLQQQVSGLKRQLKNNYESLRELAELKKTAAQRDTELQEALAELAKIKELRIEDNRTLITNDLLFRVGSFQLTDQGKQILKDIWNVLQNYPDREILIVGHTDNQPIAKEHVDVYRSNWDLSTWRALAVLHFLRYQTEAPEERLRVMGAGEFQPVADNSTPEGRSQNRRVEIIIGPRLN